MAGVLKKESWPNPRDRVGEMRKKRFVEEVIGMWRMLKGIDMPDEL